MGQDTPVASYSSVSGDISVASIVVQPPYTSNHFVAYLNISPDPAGAHWMQAGYGKGSVEGFNNTTGNLEPYEEQISVEAPPHVNWVTAWGLTQDDYVTVNATGAQDILGDWEYTSYIHPTTIRNEPVGDAWYSQEVGGANAQTESQNAVSAACPSIAQYEYFGTDGSGHGGNLSTYELQLGTPGFGYQPWDLANYVSHTVWAQPVLPASPFPYTYHGLFSASAFEGWGS